VALRLAAWGPGRAAALRGCRSATAQGRSPEVAAADEGLGARTKREPVFTDRLRGEE